MTADPDPGPYQVIATRSGQWWAVTCPDLPGLFTQARRFREIEAMATEAIALLLDVDPTSVGVVVTAALGDELDRKIVRRREVLAELEVVQRDAAATSVEVLRHMAEVGLTQRDAADVLGISFQRVGQLWPG